jgi:sugar (pentulose or hexulose) kinase
MEGNGQTRQLIEEGGAILGIEMGSTRIKGVLINENNEPIAQGSHEWENRLENGIWTYSMEDVRAGIADCYRDLRRRCEKTVTA